MPDVSYNDYMTKFDRIIYIFWWAYGIQLTALIFIKVYYATTTEEITTSLWMFCALFWFFGHCVMTRMSDRSHDLTKKSLALNEEILKNTKNIANQNLRLIKENSELRKKCANTNIS